MIYFKSISGLWSTLVNLWLLWGWCGWRGSDLSRTAEGTEHLLGPTRVLSHVPMLYRGRLLGGTAPLRPWLNRSGWVPVGVHHVRAWWSPAQQVQQPGSIGVLRCFSLPYLWPILISLLCWRFSGELPVYCVHHNYFSFLPGSTWWNTNMTHVYMFIFSVNTLIQTFLGQRFTGSHSWDVSAQKKTNLFTSESKQQQTQSFQ